MSSDYQLWQDLVERFEFFLMLAALCACGYLAWNQFIYIVFTLIFGGISAAMVPLYNVAQDKLEELENLDEVESLNALSILQEAENIIVDYSSKNSAIENKINSFIDKLYESQQKANNNHVNKKEKRDKIEKTWQQYIIEKRRQKGLNYGAPPNNDSNICPKGYPIRATENLNGKKYRNERYRGIYYKPDDIPYNSINASWCFESVEHAEADKFRRKKKRKRRKKN